MHFFGVEKKNGNKMLGDLHFIQNYFNSYFWSSINFKAFQVAKKVLHSLM